MLELRLRSGMVVAFDGRVVEVFADGGPSRRFPPRPAGHDRSGRRETATGVKLCGGMLQFGDSTLGLAGLRERAACERPRHGGLDRHTDLVCEAGRGKRAIGGDVSIPSLERDSRQGSVCH